MTKRTAKHASVDAEALDSSLRRDQIASGGPFPQTMRQKMTIGKGTFIRVLIRALVIPCDVLSSPLLVYFVGKKTPFRKKTFSGKPLLAPALDTCCAALA